MWKTLICLIFLSQILNLLIYCEPKVNGPCAHPGIPPNSELNDIPINRKRFQNQERVRIDCKKDGFDVFPFYEHNIQCINGRWIGGEPRCGMNLKAQAIQMDVRLCSDGYNKPEPQSLNQTDENSEGIPFNAFHYNRVDSNQTLHISGPDCPRYKITFDDRIQIWFLIIELNIEETIVSNQTIVAPDLKPFVSQYRSCDLRKTTETEYKEYNSITFAYYFICDLISDSNYTEEKPTNEIIFDFEVNQNNIAMIEGIFIGKIITDSSKRVPKCGKVAMNIGIEYHEEIGYYLIGCNDSFIDLSKNSTDNQNPKYKIVCDRNGQWTKNWPICYPKTPCPTDILMKEIDGSVIIEEFGNVYYFNGFNESKWFAINNSFVRYSCVDEHHRMVGKNIRTCLENGTWTSKTPTCLGVKETKSQETMRQTDVPAIIGSLFAILIVFVAIVLIVFRKHSKRVNKELKKTRNEIQESNNKRLSEELYSDVCNGNLYDIGSERTDIYDAIDFSIVNQIRNQKLKTSDYIEMNGTDMALIKTFIKEESEYC